MAISNYDLTRNRVRGEFLKYDQQRMIDKFSLAHDKSYLYVTMLHRDYRIDRGSGVIEWSDDGFATTFEADFNSSLTICDVLCDSKDGAALSGRYCGVRSLRGTVKSGGLGDELFQSSADAFNGHTDALREACRRFGTLITLSGDVAARLDAFPFLPVILQFWEADEDFPAALKFLFDENILDFMRFETVFYLMGHILDRIREVM